MSTENIVVDPEAEQAPVSQEESPAQQEQTRLERELPKKFEGKSPSEIADMYLQLESEYGRRGNELGQLRRLTDELLGLQRAKEEAAQAAKSPPKKITSDDLFTDPDATITEKARQAAEERASMTDARVAHLEGQLVEAAFERKHPGFRETLADEDFINFVRQSPYRANLVAKAAQNDWNAADELFIAYEEQKALLASKAPQRSAANEAEKVGLVKSGGSSASGVVSRNDGKKVYSRHELINMRIRNPEEFDARYQSEFLPAYLEGRVK